MRTWLMFAVVALAFAALPALAVSRDAFVGTWEVVVSPDEDAASAGEKEYKDTFTFKGMQFKSAKASAKGFESIQYEEDTRAGIAATFKATGKSKKDETKATWTGTSTANTLSGELTWTRPDGTVLHYTFKGERKG